jgi:hypothetical protein
VPEITAQRNADRVLTSIGLPFGVIPSPVQTGAAELRALLPGCQCRRPARPVKGAKILCRSPVTGEPYGLPLCLSRIPERSKHLRVPLRGADP